MALIITFICTNLIAAHHVRGIRLFNHASPEKNLRTAGSTCSRLQAFASHAQSSKCVSQMLSDSVHSLVTCNLFSHALFWGVWPAARFGLWLTLDMSEAEVRPRTRTDTSPAQSSNTRMASEVRFLLTCLIFIT